MTHESPPKCTEGNDTIIGPKGMAKLKRKSNSVHWELAKKTGEITKRPVEREDDQCHCLMMKRNYKGFHR